MKIYIRMIEVETGRAAWFNDTDWKEDPDTGKVKHVYGGEQYFEDGWDIYGKPAYHYDWLRPSPFPNIAALKQGIKDAKRQWSWDGCDTRKNKFKLELWAWIRQDFRLVELQPDDTFKVVGSYKKDMHPENDDKWNY